MTKLLGSWDPVVLDVLELLEMELPLGVMGLTSLGVCTQFKLAQTRRNPGHWSGEVPMSLDLFDPSYSGWC